MSINARLTSINQKGLQCTVQVKHDRVQTLPQLLSYIKLGSEEFSPCHIRAEVRFTQILAAGLMKEMMDQKDVGIW